MASCFTGFFSCSPSGMPRFFCPAGLLWDLWPALFRSSGPPGPRGPLVLLALLALALQTLWSSGFWHSRPLASPFRAFVPCFGPVSLALGLCASLRGLCASLWAFVPHFGPLCLTLGLCASLWAFVPSRLRHSTTRSSRLRCSVTRSSRIVLFASSGWIVLSIGYICLVLSTNSLLCGLFCPHLLGGLFCLHYLSFATLDFAALCAFCFIVDFSVHSLLSFGFFCLKFWGPFAMFSLAALSRPSGLPAAFWVLRRLFSGNEKGGVRESAPAPPEGENLDMYPTISLSSCLRLRSRSRLAVSLISHLSH